MKEADGVADGVFDEHASCVAREEFDVGCWIVGEKDGGLIMAEVESIDLAEWPAMDTNLLFEDLWGFEGSCGDVQAQATPSRWGEGVDFPEDIGCAASEGDEEDLHLV